MADEIGLIASLKPEVDKRAAEKEVRDLERQFSKANLSPKGIARGAGRAAKGAGKFGAHVAGAKVARAAGLPVTIPSTSIPDMLGMGGSGGSGGASVGGSTAGEPDDFIPLLQAQLAVQEEILDELQDMGSLGGGGDGRFPLRPQRPGGGGGGGGMGGLLAFFGAGAAMAVPQPEEIGVAIRQEIENVDLPPFPEPDWVPIDVKEPGEPDWLPIVIDQPDWLPIGIPEPDWLPIEVTEPTETPGPSGTPIGLPNWVTDPNPDTGPSPTPSPTPGPHRGPSPSPGPSGGIDLPDWVTSPEALAAGGAAGLFGLSRLISRGAVGAAGGGLVLPPSAAETLRPGSEDSIRRRNKLRGFIGMDPLGRDEVGVEPYAGYSPGNGTQNLAKEHANQQEAVRMDATIENHFHINPSDLNSLNRETQRKVDQAIDELEQKLENMVGGFGVAGIR